MTTCPALSERGAILVTMNATLSQSKKAVLLTDEAIQKLRNLANIRAELDDDPALAEECVKALDAPQCLAVKINIEMAYEDYDPNEQTTPSRIEFVYAEPESQQQVSADIYNHIQTLTTQLGENVTRHFNVYADRETCLVAKDTTILTAGQVPEGLIAEMASHYDEENADAYDMTPELMTARSEAANRAFESFKWPGVEPKVVCAWTPKSGTMWARTLTFVEVGRDIMGTFCVVFKAEDSVDVADVFLESDPHAK